MAVSYTHLDVYKRQVLLVVHGTLKRMLFMAVLSVVVGLGLAVFAQAVLRQPPQDWIGLLGLALAVTYYVVNLGQQRPDRQEQEDGHCLLYTSRCV